MIGIEKIEKAMYKSAITGKLFDTYEEAYEHDCLEFVEQLCDNGSWSYFINNDILNEDEVTLYKLNNKEELEMFSKGIIESYCIENEYSFLRQVKDVNKFPCIIMHFESTLYTQDKFINMLKDIIEKTNQECDSFKKTI